MKTLSENPINKGSKFADFVRFRPHIYTRNLFYFIRYSPLWKEQKQISGFYQKNSTFSQITNIVVQSIGLERK